MAIRIGINGFGRIGRNVLRASLGDPALEFVAINDLTDAKTLAYLLKYDSIHGVLDIPVEAKDDYLIVDSRPIKILAVKDPKDLPWRNLGVDYVIESTGRFTTRDDAANHPAAGAKRGLISAPSKDADATPVLGAERALDGPDGRTGGGREARRRQRRLPGGGPGSPPGNPAVFRGSGGLGGHERESSLGHRGRPADHGARQAYGEGHCLVRQ